MVDAVGGSAIATQLQGSSSFNVAAIRNEREQSEAVVRSVDQTTQVARQDTAESTGRGRSLDVRV